jgi:CubicO group peptidase (beta-lactamase class C family)
MIIEKLDKRTYGESLSSRILKPLKMDHTYFISERKLVPHRAEGYSWEKTEFQHAPYLNMDWPYAAGSIESTVLDLAKWDEALYGETILPHKLLEQMWSATNLSDGTVQKYGFGWQVDTMNGSPIVEHGGGIHGFTTFIRRAPTAGITVIVLTNTDGPSNPASLAKQAMGIMEPSLKAAESKPEADTSPETTKKAQAILQSVLEGKFDRTSLTPDFAKVMTDEVLVQAKEQIGTLGPIKKFTFLREKKTEASTTRIYAVLFGLIELNYAVSIDDKGKIAGLEIHQ